MSAVQCLELFDSLLIQNCDHGKALKSSNKIAMLLKDFTVLEGTFLPDVFDFICWLVSDNEREVFFSKQCGIKFFHNQANDDMLKVIVNYLIISLVVVISNLF